MKTKILIFLISGMFILPSVSRAQEADTKQPVYPKKIEVDQNHDGKADHTELFKDGKIVHMEEDSNFDGKPDKWVDYQDGKPVRSEEDTNGDGKPDTWVTY